MKTDKLITKLNVCESDSTETRKQMLARVFEEPTLLAPSTAYEHARDVIRGIWPLGEEVIQESAKWSYEYAEFIGERFLEGERAIATDARYSYLYALKVLDCQPFPAGEAEIATEALYSYRYARDVLHGPFPAGEPAIATSAEYSYLYAHGALDGKPFPAGEPAITMDAEYCEWYARDILDGDWSRFNQDENR